VNLTLLLAAHSAGRTSKTNCSPKKYQNSNSDEKVCRRHAGQVDFDFGVDWILRYDQWSPLRRFSCKFNNHPSYQERKLIQYFV
jgi:hypothetical protein